MSVSGNVVAPRVGMPESGLFNGVDNSTDRKAGTQSRATPSRLSTLSAIPILLTLAACGGDDPSAPAPQPSTSQTPAPTPSPSPEPTVLDYLIQNVCTDANDQPVAGDPATCERARDLRIGETPPYQLYDQGHYQAVSSVPQDGDRILVTRRLADYDGYDLIQYGDPVQFIRTADPGCGEQTIEGWVLFPRTPGAGSTRHDQRITRINPPPACVEANTVDGQYRADSVVSDHSVEAVWTAPESYRFETGKELLAIRSEHRAHFDLSRKDNAIEVFYFTREYGFSRWEAWVPEKRCSEIKCDTAPLVGRCAPGKADWGGQPWVRIDCRDETEVVL